MKCSSAFAILFEIKIDFDILFIIQIRMLIELFLVILCVIFFSRISSSKKQLNYDLILLIGRKGVGKDTIGNYMESKTNFKTCALATPLKNALKELFDFSDEQLNGTLKEAIDPRWNITPRDAMKKMYIDFPKSLGLDLTFFAKLFEQTHPEMKKIITDARSPLMISYFSSRYKCFVIKIERDCFVKDNHISETECDDFENYDLLIKNNGSLEDLYQTLDEFIYR